MDAAIVYVSATLSIVALALLIAKPLWGVLGILIVKPLVDATWATPVLLDFKLTEIVSTAVPLILLGRMILGADHRRPFSSMPLHWIWLTWSLDVIAFSSFILLSQGWTEGLQVMMRHLNGLAGFYMLQAYCEDDRDFRRFAWALAIAGLFPIATGVIEGVTGVHWRVTLGEDNVVRNIGMYHDAITIRFYALQTIMGLFLIVSLSKRSTSLMLLSLMYGLAAAFVLKGAYSKSGFITLGAWLILWPILRKDVKTLLGVGAALLVVAVYYSQEIMESFGFVFVKEIAAINGQVGVEHTFAGRWYLWEDMWNEWLSLGPAKQFLGAGHIANGAHNDYLQILFHGGLVGLAIYVTLLLITAWSIGRFIVREVNVFSMAALYVFIMWIIDTIGLVPSTYSGYQWFVWGVIGFCLRRLRNESASTENRITLPAQGPRFSNLLGAS
jgi:hypothetical protein